MPRHVRRRHLTTFLFVTALLLAAPPAFAGAPTDHLREFFANVNAILADPATEGRPLERVARVRRLVADVADMRAAAASALGPEWETKTPAERDEFVTLFAEVLERAYVGRLAGAGRAAGGVVMRYGDEVIAGDDAKVMTALRALGAHDLRVEYRMTVRGGRWRVRDIVIDGVSTVENYRAQFARLLQRASYVALVAQLRDKLAGESLMFARLERATSPVATAPPPPAAREIVAAVVPPPADVEPVPLIREPAPAPARTPTRPVQVERVTRSEPAAPRPVPLPIERAPRSAPLATVASNAAVASSAPVALVAGPVTLGEPSGVEAAMGALLLALIGVGGATLLRRRPTLTH